MRRPDRAGVRRRPVGLVIRREAGTYLCNDHPEFAGDEYAAAFHLRTAHSKLWQQLEGIAVVPVTAPGREPGPARRSRTPRPATRPHERRGGRRGGRP